MSTTRRASGRSAARILGLLLATVAMLPRTAWGQTDTATREAESRFKEGLKHHDAGDEEGARLSFLEAYSVLKRPNLLFNLARAEQLTGHPVDALAHYKVFVADNTVAVADRETARTHIVELNGMLGHIQIDASTGSEVSIDGQPLSGKAPFVEAVDVPTGPHSLEARLGDQTKMAGVSCVGGQTVTAKLEIQPPPVASEVVTPAPPAARAEPEEEANAPVTYVASAGKIATTAVLGAVAVAGVGLGVGMQLAASAKGNDVANDQQGGNASSCSTMTSARCTRLASDTRAETSDENVRTGAFIGAGVFAAAAAIAWAAWPNTYAVRSARRLVPLVSPGFAGLEFVTAF
jgi:hypothetical protein